MKIVHRYSLAATDQARSSLAGYGITVSPPGLATFEVDESHDHFAEIDAIARQLRAVDIISTRFTAPEVRAATWSELVSEWHHGYPQPEQDFGYRAATYDTTMFCAVCGIGLLQKAPFRMKAEPKWGSRHILQLNWVFGEFFVRPDAWSELIDSLGLHVAPVESVDGRPLHTVQQLMIDADIDVDTASLRGTPCAACGRVKYEPHVRGPFPRPAEPPSSLVVRTRQWFGSGASAFQPVLIHRSVREAMVAARLKGASFTPAVNPH